MSILIHTHRLIPKKISSALQIAPHLCAMGASPCFLLLTKSSTLRSHEAE